MAKIILCIIIVLVIIYIVPFLIYSLFSIVVGLEPPSGESPSQFLMSVLVTKIGTAIAFVLIFYFTRNIWSGQVLLYAFIWWVMTRLPSGASAARYTVGKQ